MTASPKTPLVIVKKDPETGTPEVEINPTPETPAAEEKTPPKISVDSKKTVTASGKTVDKDEPVVVAKTPAVKTLVVKKSVDKEIKQIEKVEEEAE